MVDFIFTLYQYILLIIVPKDKLKSRYFDLQSHN